MQLCMNLFTSLIQLTARKGTIYGIANMETSRHWLMLGFWVMTTFPNSLAMCTDEIHLRFHPCDMQENYTTNVVKFFCNDKTLRSIPDIFLNTTFLDASYNEISNLTGESLQGCEHLETLKLDRMSKSRNVTIAEGVFTNLTKLKVLCLNDLGLSKVPTELPSSLTELRLDRNKIFSLSSRNFSQLRGLTKLYLSKNCYYFNSCFRSFKIDNRTFSSLDKLEHLSLSYNNLSHVPRDLPVSLITLDLASNMISSIGEDDFKELSNLKTLKIQGNCPRCHNAPYPCVPCANGSINIHIRAFDHLRNLTLLHLAGNSISVMQKDWFENLTNLRELYLSYNFLSDQIEHGNFLSNLWFLRKLDLSYNYGLQSYPETVNLSQSFANLSSLRTLHMQGLVFRKIEKDSLKHLYGLQNLSTLDLGINFIVAVDPDVFKQFHHLKLLYLSENRLYPITNSEVRRADNSVKPPRFNLPGLMDSSPQRQQEPFIKPIPRLIKPECFAAGRVLDLSRNNLFFISPKQFEGYENISCLNLSRNGFASALNGTEFTTLPNLKYLDLSCNKIDLAYNYAFEELKELEVLDISSNSHYFRVPGVTHNLFFIQNLPKLRVLNMSSNSIFTLTTRYMCSDSLAELQFQDNQLGKLWKDEKYVKLFWNLTNLTNLDISSNSIWTIHANVYKYLPVTLKRFRLSHNYLKSLNWTLMRNFIQLEELILSHNSMTYVSGNITLNMPSLRYLDLSYNKISQLEDRFLENALNLKKLDLSYNKISTIHNSTFPSNEALHLETLCLHNNPYHCTCGMLDFILWIKNSKVKIPKLYTSLKCSVPEAIKGDRLITFDIKQCLDPNVAWIYIVTTLFIVCVTFVATLMHLFYWDLSYVFYFTKAKVKGYQHLSSRDNVYDAFVTYDTKDPQVSDWVLNHLRVQLEEQGDHFLPVCLEERDWLPGCPILDSLTRSIRQSRKTVFVLTHSYVNSGSFKMAMYLAHQRLLDESDDVIVLLLLEPVLQNSHFLRLRRRLCSHSVLEWPRTPAAEPWFWQCLRNAIRVENKVVYNNIYSRYFTIKKRPREK